MSFLYGMKRTLGGGEKDPSAVAQPIDAIAKEQPAEGVAKEQPADAELSVREKEKIQFETDMLLFADDSPVAGLRQIAKGTNGKIYLDNDDQQTVWKVEKQQDGPFETVA